MRGRLLLVFLAACPPGHPPGPSGTECDEIADCNAASCGELVPCVRGFCIAEAPPVVVHCSDAGPAPDGGLFECDFWDDCNPGTECGDDLVACVGGRCDPEAPPVDIPCEDPD